MEIISSLPASSSCVLQHIVNSLESARSQMRGKSQVTCHRERLGLWQTGTTCSVWAGQLLLLSPACGLRELSLSTDMPFEFSREAKNLDKTVENLIFFTLAIGGGREVVRENKTKQKPPGCVCRWPGLRFMWPVMLNICSLWVELPRFGLTRTEQAG